MRKLAPFILAVFIVLTRPDGKPVLINVDQITMVTDSIYTPRHVQVSTQGANETVRETFDEVVEKIRNAK